VESFGSANCDTSWKRTLDSLISFSFLLCQLITTPKRCHLHQRRKKPRSDKFSSLPLAYPESEYLQLGMSNAAPRISFHQRQANCYFQVASSGLHESIYEGLRRHQRFVSYSSVPAQRAVANHSFARSSQIHIHATRPRSRPGSHQRISHPQVRGVD
jgi:hypothetical protein